MSDFGNLNVKASTSSLEVISSGVILTDDSEIFFELDDLSVKFNFLTDSNESRIESDSKNKTLIIKLFNFTDIFERGFPKPNKIGRLRSHPLHLSFLASIPEKDAKKLTYTFYVGSEENE